MLDNASVMPLDSFHINFLTFPCYWGVRKGNMNCKNKWGCCSRFSQTDINLYCQTANKLLGQCGVHLYSPAFTSTTSTHTGRVNLGGWLLRWLRTKHNV